MATHKPQYLMYKKGLKADYDLLNTFKFLLDAGCITTFNIEFIEYACQGWLEMFGPYIQETDIVLNNRKWYVKQYFVLTLLKWCEEQKQLAV